MKATCSKPKRRIALAALFVIAAFTAPAAGFDEQNLPLIASRPMIGHGAVSYRFTIPDDGSMEIEVDPLHEDASLIGAGIWLFDPAGMPLVSFMSTGIAGGDLEVHLELPDPFGVIRDVRPEPPSEFGGGMSLGISGLPAGRYVVVAGSVSNGRFASGTVSLRGSVGSVLNATKTSRGGFALTEADFNGTTAVVGAPVGPPIFVPAPVYVGRARPVAMVDASASVGVSRNLYGWFAGYDPVARLTVAGPGGSSAAPSHQFEGSQAGAYTFTVDLDLGAPHGSAWVWGLDVARA